MNVGAGKSYKTIVSARFCCTCTKSNKSLDIPRGMFTNSVNRLWGGDSESFMWIVFGDWNVTSFCHKQIGIFWTVVWRKRLSTIIVANECKHVSWSRWERFIHADMQQGTCSACVCRGSWSRQQTGQIWWLQLVTQQRKKRARSSNWCGVTAKCCHLYHKWQNCFLTPLRREHWMSQLSCLSYFVIWNVLYQCTCHFSAL